MTITFVNDKGTELGRVNSLSDMDIVRANGKIWADKCSAIFVSCSDKPDVIQRAKAKLMAYAKSQKFEQTEPNDANSQFVGTKSFVMNRVELKAKDDNTDELDDIILGA